jgi:LPS export ABC transporter protein LptC
VHISLVKHLRGFLLGIIALVVLLVGVNYLYTWYRRVHAIKQTMQILSTETARSAESIEYSEYENGFVRFKIRARKLLEMRQGKSFLEGIEAEDFKPDGSIRNQISSKRAEYDKEGNIAEFSEDVHVQMGQESSLSAGNLSYDWKTNIGTIRDKLQLISKQMRGTAGGARYDNGKGTLDLTGSVDFIAFPDETRATNPMGFKEVHITSNGALFSRASHVFSFLGGAYVDGGMATLDAEQIDAILTDDERHLKSLHCQGNAVYKAKEATGQRILTGEKMIFSLNEESGALEKIEIRGQALFSSIADGQEQELGGSEIVLELDPEKGRPLRVQSTTGVRFRSKREENESIITGNRLEATFISGSNILDRVHVWVSARMSNRSAGDAQSESLLADEIQISFRELNARVGIQQLQAKGNVQWISNAAAEGNLPSSPQGRSLSADSLQMNYAADADFVESGVALGNVVFSGLPVDDAGKSQLKRMEADAMQFRFYPRANRLRNFEGDGHVRVTFHNSAPQGSKDSGQDFSASSDHMRTDFHESDGTIQSVSQWGNFVYQESSRKASAGRSDYDAQKQILVLNEKPRIEDSGSATTAEIIELNRQSKILLAHRSVRSVIKSKSGMLGAYPEKSSNTSSATLCTADELEYWLEESHARYLGNVQMLSESSQLQANALEIFNGGERLVAEGNVRHIVRQMGVVKNMDLPKATEVNGIKRSKDSRSENFILITSLRLEYTRSKSLLMYSGKVDLRGEDYDMTAENLEVMLDSEGKQIDRATARGKVVIHQMAREARGDLADYYLSLRKFVVVGNNAEIIDPQRGKSTAHRLTFFASDDRILLENR